MLMSDGLLQGLGEKRKSSRLGADGRNVLMSVPAQKYSFCGSLREKRGKKEGQGHRNLDKFRIQAIIFRYTFPKGT